MSLGKNAVVGLTTDIIAFGLGIILSVVLTRSLGVDQRGIYVVLVTTNIVASNIIGLNVGAACSTFLARGRYRLGEVHGVAIIMAVALGVVSVVALSLAYPFLAGSVFKNVRYEYLLVALGLIAATVYQNYWNYMLMGLNRVVLMNQFNLVVNFANTGLMLLAVGVLRLGIPGFLAAWAISATGAALGAIILASRLEGIVAPRTPTLRDLLGFSLRGYGASLSHHLFLRFDMFAVNALIGTRAVGLYSISTSTAEKLWVPINALHSASMGKIAQLPHEESALLAAKVSRTVLLVMVSLALPFAVVSPWLIPFMYGPEFEASVVPLIILLGGSLAFAVMLVLNNYVIGQMERPGLLSIISWFELAVSIPLYLVLTVQMGIVGAAIASSLTYLIAMCATLFVFVRDSHLPVSQVLVPRRSDFLDYARVLRRGLGRVPLLRRYVQEATASER